MGLGQDWGLRVPNIRYNSSTPGFGLGPRSGRFRIALESRFRDKGLLYHRTLLEAEASFLAFRHNAHLTFFCTEMTDPF